MIHYRFELTGTSDDPDAQLYDVRDIVAEAIKELKAKGFGVGGIIVAHDTDIDGAAISMSALDLPEDDAKQDKAVRERYADQKKARREELAKGSKEAQAEAKRQREVARRTGDRGAGDVLTGDRGAASASPLAEPAVVAAIEAGAVVPASRAGTTTKATSTSKASATASPAPKSKGK